MSQSFSMPRKRLSKSSGVCLPTCVLPLPSRPSASGKPRWHGRKWMCWAAWHTSQRCEIIVDRGLSKVSMKLKRPRMALIWKLSRDVIRSSNCRNWRRGVNASFRTSCFWMLQQDRKSTRLNSSHTVISYAVFCLKKKKIGAHSEFDFSTKNVDEVGRYNPIVTEPSPSQSPTTGKYHDAAITIAPACAPAQTVLDK